MQQLIGVWQALDTRRRLIVAGATIMMFVAILALSGMATKPSMALLYARLDATQAGDVIGVLDQRGVAYEVRGDAIYVEAPHRDELRMMLAGEGLPATGGAGYELLDSLSGFGTTSQMFDAAYWRAKEGELARTITASPHIKAARVHIANPSGQPFRQDLRPSASVSVTTATGGLSPAHAKALKYLVASAVSGLQPEDVSVIDGAGGLIASGDETPEAAGGESRAQQIKRNVERLLEARVGYGNAVVEVSVDTVTEREAITEKRFDPNGRVAISSETEERTNSADDTRPGAVTVASNLPEDDAAGEGRSKSQGSETRERVNFEVSETTREVLRAPGAIRRLSVAVLVDGIEVTGADGAPSWQPRPEEEMAALRDLVASAVGFDEARGDIITLKSMPFEPMIAAGSTAGGGLLSSMAFDVMSLIQLAVLAIVALVLGLFVLRPILARPAPLALPDRPAIAEGAGPTRALTGEIDEGEFAPRNLPVVSGPDLPTMETADADGIGQEADPVRRLKRLISERQDETVEILRNWMEDQEEKAT